MKRFVDILLLLLISPLVIWILPLISLYIKLSDRGPVLYWSDRVGKNNQIFKMPKFRTMRIDTPQVATHLLAGEKYLIPGGGIIRKLSLDEFPQLWSIFKGDMSFVGPRPALFNQDDLIDLRTKKGVHKLVPGLTGLAQVNGRDEISIAEKVSFDEEYLHKKDLFLDFKILFKTFVNVIRVKGVSH